jgi:hypothetical protein
LSARDRLRRPAGRTLLDLNPKPLSAIEVQLAERCILDPDRPQPPGRKLGRFLFR